MHTHAWALKNYYITETLCTPFYVLDCHAITKMSTFDLSWSLYPGIVKVKDSLLFITTDTVVISMFNLINLRWLNLLSASPVEST